MYIGTVINDSPTIAAEVGEIIANAAFRAVKFNEEGKIVLAGKGDIPIGIITAEYDDVIVGDDVTVQIKDIGLITTGAEIKAGAALACSTDGSVQTASTGDFILGFALESAGKDSTVRIQITKSGYVQGTSGQEDTEKEGESV